MAQSSIYISTTNDPVSGFPSWSAALEALFGSVVEIRGYLFISDGGNQLLDFTFMKSLRVVRGLDQSEVRRRMHGHLYGLVLA